MPFEGRGTEAYDNITKQYVNTWIDNMGTGIMHSTGPCQDAGKKCPYLQRHGLRPSAGRWALFSHGRLGLC
jgi:hypothetical protein